MNHYLYKNFIVEVLNEPTYELGSTNKDFNYEKIFFSDDGQEYYPTSKHGIKIYRDNSASSVSVGKFYKNHYHTLVMAPTSSNTVAKCVYGISDSLASNIFAQAGKCRVFCIFFPCDTAPELKTLAPSGYVDVYPRKVDLENVKKLKNFNDIDVVMSFKKLEEKILQRIKDV